MSCQNFEMKKKTRRYCRANIDLYNFTSNVRKYCWIIKLLNEKAGRSFPRETNTSKHTNNLTIHIEEDDDDDDESKTNDCRYTHNVI